MEIFELRLTKSVITTALCGVCFKGARTHMYAAWHKHLSRWQLSPIGLKELGHTHRHTLSPSASNSNCRPGRREEKITVQGLPPPAAAPTAGTEAHYADWKEFVDRWIALLPPKLELEALAGECHSQDFVGWGLNWQLVVRETLLMERP